ncbi:TonB-dependent receptor [Saccharobesus litoralis]|uniref:TonB-dependent receptor n=1 Tax=Saccharobesus litoralis TaxID=2172099 RepID=A0A2S0VNB4_9ALTE|nr:TonB-dependent receptor [Saccharobesus litoralis]AWB65714.1 TonB-dependent receptor [Saccharobesus litoralis]
MKLSVTRFVVKPLFSLLPTFVLASVAQGQVIEHIKVTANRIDTEVRQQVGSVAVLDKTYLQLTGASHIQQALSKVPGANFARGEGQEYLPALRSPVLTGAGACGSVLSAVDGIALRAAGFCNINELFDSPFEVAESIEVIRGPWSALYGSNAMYGVVNVVSPKVDVFADRLAVNVGPHGQLNGQVSANYQQQQHGFRLDAAVGKDEGWRDDSGYANQKLLARHEYTHGGFSVTSQLTLSNLNQETAGYLVGTDSYKNRKLAATNPNPEAYRDAQSVRWYTRVENTLNEGFSWQITPYARYTSMKFLQHFLPGTPLEKNGHASIGVQSLIDMQLSSQASLQFGLDSEYTQGFLQEFQAQPTQGSEFLQATIPTGYHYDYDVSATVVAPFMQYQRQLSEVLSMTASLRFEHVSYDYQNNMLAGRTNDQGEACGFGGCRFSRPESRDDSFSHFSPKLGFIYQLNESNQLFANLARGYRAPQATELYRLQREQSVADLDAEQLDSIEIGMRGELGKLNYELAAYDMQRDNIIIRDANYFNVADGKMTSRGLELYAQYGLSDTWFVELTANYGEHEYGNAATYREIDIVGHQVDSAPKHFGRLALTWQPVDEISLVAETLYQGRYYTDAENQHGYPGHQVLNFRAKYQWSPEVDVYLRWLNVSNKAYAERADFSGFSGDRYFPGQASALYLGAAISY